MDTLEMEISKTAIQSPSGRGTEIKCKLAGQIGRRVKSFL